jgi:hypothetical protein
VTSRILESREPLLLNRPEHYEGVEMVGTAPRSYLGVPIIAGEKAIGVVSVQSIEEEGRFDDSDARLLSTIAANVGVAIQNARLFAEQREAEQKYRDLVELLPLAVYRDLPDSNRDLRVHQPEGRDDVRLSARGVDRPGLSSLPCCIRTTANRRWPTSRMRSAVGSTAGRPSTA